MKFSFKVKTNKNWINLKCKRNEIYSIMLQMSSSSNYERQSDNNNSNINVNQMSRSNRSSKKKSSTAAPFLFLSNILKKKKILGFEEIREMNTRTRSEPSGDSELLPRAILLINTRILMKFICVDFSLQLWAITARCHQDNLLFLHSVWPQQGFTVGRT